MAAVRFGGFAGVLGSAMLVSAVPIAIGGIWLIALGGSVFYAVIAAGLIASGWLLLRRSSWAMSTFAALLAATAVWSLWEVGFDWWALAPRIGVLSIFAILLAMPWPRRSLSSAGSGPASRRTGGRVSHAALLFAAIAAVVLVSLVSWTRDPHAVDGALAPSQGRAQVVGDAAEGVPPGEWHAYGRTGFGQRYSPLRQIDPSNVDRLAVAWHYHTGDLRGRPGDPTETTDEVTPLKVGKRLFLCTPHQLVIALDATTGDELWRYDPRIEAKLALQHLTCRGLSYASARNRHGRSFGTIRRATARGRRPRRPSGRRPANRLPAPNATRSVARRSSSCRPQTAASSRSTLKPARSARLSAAVPARSTCGPACRTCGRVPTIRRRRSSSRRDSSSSAAACSTTCRRMNNPA